ncbi:MAG: TfoX/Sxy family protein [Firmicutes bacterium]|nr:TfoX/Sxy family protein [[Eubacterium] siraeum]MCM1488412.1 TfoX/Sxy family protein [Bacillota bacterium]
MATTKEYLNFILEALSKAEGVSHRAMMGEYVIYFKDKVAGGIYDNRFLVKPVEAAKALMPNAEYALPYEGAKEMLMVDNLEDKDFLAELMEAMYPQLPELKKRKKK